MTFHILEAPSALPQFPFLPAPFFPRALLQHPQPEGCRDWGGCSTQPRGFGASLTLGLFTTTSKSKTSAAHGAAWHGCAVFPRCRKPARGETLTSSPSEGGLLTSNIPWEAQSRSWHHTGRARGGGKTPTPLLEGPIQSFPYPSLPLPPPFPCPQLPWLPLLLREGEAVQLARGGSGQAV